MSVRRAARFASRAAVVAGLFATRIVHAQSAFDVAQQHYRRGIALYQAHSTDAALAEFRTSIALYPSPNPRLYVARCLRELGRPGPAVLEYDRTQREAADGARVDPRYGPTRDAAADEGRALRSHVGEVRVTIVPRPVSLRVRLGGETLPATAVGLPFPLTPGPVELDVSAPGHAPLHRDLRIEAGQRVSFDVRLYRYPSTARVAGGVLVWAGGAVFVAGMAGFAATGLAADRVFDDLQTQCGGVRCPASDRARIDTGRTLDSVANGALVGALVGAVMAGAGALLFATGTPGGWPRASAATF